MEPCQHVYDVIPGSEFRRHDNLQERLASRWGCNGIWAWASEAPLLYCLNVGPNTPPYALLLHTSQVTQTYQAQVIVLTTETAFRKHLSCCVHSFLDLVQSERFFLSLNIEQVQCGSTRKLEERFLWRNTCLAWFNENAIKGIIKGVYLGLNQVCLSVA